MNGNYKNELFSDFFMKKHEYILDNKYDTKLDNETIINLKMQIDLCLLYRNQKDLIIPLLDKFILLINENFHISLFPFFVYEQIINIGNGNDEQIAFKVIIIAKYLCDNMETEEILNLKIIPFLFHVVEESKDISCISTALKLLISLLPTYYNFDINFKQIINFMFKNDLFYVNAELDMQLFAYLNIAIPLFDFTIEEMSFINSNFMKHLQLTKNIGLFRAIYSTKYWEINVFSLEEFIHIINFCLNNPGSFEIDNLYQILKIAGICNTLKIDIWNQNIIGFFIDIYDNSTEEHSSLLSKFFMVSSNYIKNLLKSQFNLSMIDTSTIFTLFNLAIDSFCYKNFKFQSSCYQFITLCVNSFPQYFEQEFQSNSSVFLDFTENLNDWILSN